MGEHERIKALWNPDKKAFETKIRKIPASEHPILDLPLPRVGPLGPFTKLVEEYLVYLRKGEKLFPFKESRAWVITNHITGKWNHYFRAHSLSYQVNKIGSALHVAKQRGIENPTTIAHYYRGDWIVDKEKLKE